MNRNIAIAIGAAIVGALIVFLYYIIVPPAPSEGPEAKCVGAKCFVDIYVYGECGNPNVISAIPPVKPIARGNANPLIEWTIRTGGYTFASNGIDFHGDSQFSNPRPQGSTKFQWSDANSDTLYHKYAINLLHNGAACPTQDPGIINGQ